MVRILEINAQNPWWSQGVELLITTKAEKR